MSGRESRLVADDRRIVRLVGGDRLATFLEIFPPFGGPIVLPKLTLSGSFTLGVELSAEQVLPELTLTGSFTVAVAMGSSALVLPELTLTGSPTPQVEVTGSLVLPELTLAGSFSPVVEFTGSLALPELTLAGSFSPVVEFTGSLALPALTLTGSFTVAVAMGSSALVLPELTLTGSPTPQVEVTGSLVLPELTLAGSFSPVVEFTGSLALPALTLTGSFTVAVAMGSSDLTLPALQLSGSPTPVVEVSGDLVLPLLDLAGDFTPLVEVSGDLVLPELTLAASPAPLVEVSGTLVLPELTLAGSFSVAPSKITAMLSLADSAQSGGEWTSLVDVLNSNPATSNVARRAAVSASANGLPTATFATNDCVSWPILAGQNYATATPFGVGVWLNPAALAATQGVYEITNFLGTGGANARAFELTVRASRATRLLVGNASAQTFTGTSADNALPAAGNWFWLRAHYDPAGVGSAGKIKIYVDGVQLALTFGITGTLGALPAAAGNVLIGDIRDDGTPSAPYGGDVGPKFFVFNADLSAAEEAAIMNFHKPT